MEQRAALKRTVKRGAISLVIDDITDIDVEGFVFYARPDLALGTGFGTAISTRGGASIQKELEEKGPLKTGEVVVTGAGKLKSRHIVHAVGPRFQEEDMDAKLRTTVLNSLKAADKARIQRLAMPAMGAGFYGVPLGDCARAMVDSIRGYLEGETGIEEVILCVLDSREYGPFEAELKKIS